MGRPRIAALACLQPSARAAVLIVSVGCAGGAVPQTDPNAIPEHGQYVTLYQDPGQAPCAGSAPMVSPGAVQSDDRSEAG